MTHSKKKAKMELGSRFDDKNTFNFCLISIHTSFLTTYTVVSVANVIFSFLHQNLLAWKGRPSRIHTMSRIVHA